MTDRKPDIITKWSIKENTDATYTAKCSTMPNVELTADNVVAILGKIEGYLKAMYRDTTVDGGITGINAEYNVTKRQEMSLDTFDTKDTKDTDSVKAQLLDIGKQLLESEDGLKALDNGGVTVRIGEMPTDDPTPEPATDAPELHEAAEEKPKKKPRAKKPQPNGYQWQRIKALVSGCALCERLATGECVGNKSGESCGKYVCRNEAGSQCSECNKNMKVWNEEAGKYNKPFCTVHKADISNDDFCCYAFERGRFKE